MKFINKIKFLLPLAIILSAFNVATGANQQTKDAVTTQDTASVNDTIVEDTIGEDTTTKDAVTTQDTTSVNNTIVEDTIGEDTIAIENLLQNTYTLPLKIDRITEQLALLISKHQIQNIENKGAAIGSLRDIRIILRGPLNDQLMISSIENPKLQAQISLALLRLCDSLIEYIDSALKKNFNDIKPFDIASLTKRGHAITDIAPEQLKKSFEFVKSKVEKLEKKTLFAGLTWYNIATRKFEDRILKPCKKYHIPRIAKLLTFSTLSALLFAWKFGSMYTYAQEKKFFQNKKILVDINNKDYIKGQNWLTRFIYEVVFKKFGHPYRQNFSGHVDTECIEEHPERYGLISSLDNFIAQTLLKSQPHVALCLGATFSLYQTIWKDKLKPYLKKKGNYYWNKLRGGAYEEKAVEGFWDFEPTARFKDVVGLEEVKESLSFIIQFIDNPEQYLRINTAPEKGILFTGPTRTGKSFMFEALCGELKDTLKKRGRKDEFKFWKIDSAFITECGIDSILEIAKENAPIVLFIDEIDLLGLQRVGNNKLLSEFLTSMQTTLDSDPSKQVILIAATNKPETLDKALRQYGRLGKEVRFEYPAFRFRKSYLARELHNMALDVSQFDVDGIAQKTEGKSFEDLRAIVRNAMIRSWSRGQQLTQQSLEESLDTEIRRIIAVDRKELSEEEKRTLATHFAGRALAMIFLDTHAQLDKVTIKAVMTNLHEETQWEEFAKRDERDKQKKIVHGSIFTKYLHDTIELSSHQQVVNEIKTLLAGFAAEEILLGSCSYKCHTKDSERAYSQAEALVFEGLNPRQLSKKVSRELADKAYALFVQCKHEVKELLTEHRNALAAITEVLFEYDTLTDRQLQMIIEEVEKINQVADQEEIKVKPDQQKKVQ